ncbi:MAG: serine/threonine protein kinase [Planctomycetes bacterium]|nr:serine/threonine protein kinase [Planctomycetota bacterium]
MEMATISSDGGGANSGSTSRFGLRRARWLGPAVAAALSIGVCCWIYLAARSSLRERLGEDLRALVAAQANAVRLAATASADDAARNAALAKVATVGIPGATGETLIFDADARLVAPSRFDAVLRTSVGVGAIDVRDPGVDLTTGATPTLARKSMPLTKAAGLATIGRPGFDVEGYTGARGVPVVGAWTWVPDANLGVAVEIEMAEAYGPLRPIVFAFTALAALGAAAAGVAVWIARRDAAALSRARETESKVRTLGQYTLIRRVGQGGMGEVYLARHALLRRPTAVKLLRPDVNSEHAIARFEREVQSTSRLTHPNTVQIFDFGRTPGGTFYYAMEYLVGITLDKFVADHGPLDEGRVIFILQQVCGSLNEAHELGLIHRDIKPENIVLCRAGGAFDVVKVLDFGLVMDRRSDEAVKLSATGAMLGTPTYMAPEAFLRPESVDARSDLYSLGAIGYLLLCGKPPFEGKTVVELFHQHTKEVPVAPSEKCEREILPDIEKALLACLEKDPERRPKSANALSRELEWCRSFGEWNRDKARYWWQEHEADLEKRYGLTSKATESPQPGHGTMEIRLDGR